MSRNTLVLFMCIIICGSAVEYEPILRQIPSRTNSCNNEHLFGNFDLTGVPEFGALCSIQTPNTKQLDFLLENNVVPILCMGLYDASLRICKSAKDDLTQFNDIFPPTTGKFSKIFNTLEKLDKFSSLDKFCSSTVKNYTILEPASSYTEFWWNALNLQLMDENKCMSICRTYENNKVQPLCSYIIWSNGIYLNHQKNQAESQLSAIDAGHDHINSVFEKNVDASIGEINPASSPSALESLPSIVQDVDKDHLNSVFGKNLDELKNIANEMNQPLPSAVESQPSILSSMETPERVGLALINSPDQKPFTEQAELSGVQPIVSVKLANTATGNSEQSVKTAVPSVEAGIPEHDNSVRITNITATTDSKPIDKVKNIIKQKKNSKTKKPVVTNSVPELKVDEIPKVEGGAASSNAPEVTNSQPAVQTKPSPKAADNMVEGDFSFEVTPEGVVPDPPIVADKDPQQVQPYSDDEGEDGDGDDVDLEPEGPVKAVPSESAASGKPSLVAVDQGIVADPDKSYSDQIVREDRFIDGEDSNFFTYFLCMAVLSIIAYLAFHNKKKLVALAVEGRRTRNSRRRPNVSNYSKLDCSLEEAMASKTTASVTHVLY